MKLTKKYLVPVDLLKKIIMQRSRRLKVKYPVLMACVEVKHSAFCLFLISFCSLHVRFCLLLVVFACSSLVFALCLLFFARCSLLFAYWLLMFGHWLLLFLCCLLLLALFQNLIWWKNKSSFFHNAMWHWPY